MMAASAMKMKGSRGNICTANLDIHGALQRKHVSEREIQFGNEHMKNNQRCSISQSAAERQEHLCGRPHGSSEEAESDGYHRHAESDNGYEANAETTGKEFSGNTEQGGMRDESHHHDDYGEKQQFCQYDAQRESLAVSPWLRFGYRAYHAALPECAISHGGNDDPRQWGRCHVAGECSEKPPDAFIAEQRAHGGFWRGSRNEPRHQEQCHLQSRYDSSHDGTSPHPSPIRRRHASCRYR